MIPRERRYKRTEITSRLYVKPDFRWKTVSFFDRANKSWSICSRGNAKSVRFLPQARFRLSTSQSSVRRTYHRHPYLRSELTLIEFFPPVKLCERTVCVPGPKASRGTAAAWRWNLRNCGEPDESWSRREAAEPRMLVSNERSTRGPIPTLSPRCSFPVPPDRSPSLGGIGRRKTFLRTNLWRSRRNAFFEIDASPISSFEPHYLVDKSNLDFERSVWVDFCLVKKFQIIGHRTRWIKSKLVKI